MNQNGIAKRSAQSPGVPQTARRRLHKSSCITLPGTVCAKKLEPVNHLKGVAFFTRFCSFLVHSNCVRSVVMRLLRLIAPVLAVVLMNAGPASADACSALARNAVKGISGATLLSVQSGTKSNGKVVCHVRIKLPPKGGKPGRVVTRKLSPG